LATILSQIVEVCIFRRIAVEPQYLLLQRADDEELYPGIWQIVTGSTLKNENAVQTALRELHEETGMKIKQFWAVPFIDSYYDQRKDVVQMVPVFAAEADDPYDVHLSREHQHFEWLNIAMARERVVWPGHRQALDTVHEFFIKGKAASSFLELKQL
jgi:dihydroneopterin triphosphate diphosphatase